MDSSHHPSHRRVIHHRSRRHRPRRRGRIRVPPVRRPDRLHRHRAVDRPGAAAPPERQPLPRHGRPAVNSRKPATVSRPWPDALPPRLLQAQEEGRFTAHGRPPISTTATEISRVYTAHTGDEATRVAHETVSGILMSVAYELETRLPA